MVSPRKHLVDGAGVGKTILVMMYCHLSVALLCMNVMFDLFFCGVPLYLLHHIGMTPSRIHCALTSMLINWTTPIVYGIPMVLSGTRVFVDDLDILIESKSKDSLFLANHGSRIDWMIAMFIGHLKKVGDRASIRCRVGFLSEAVIQYMPLIGWYRRFVCDDIFVTRSFSKDASVIDKNIAYFHGAGQSRMLFLNPEGVVVDHSDHDMEYIQQCQHYCRNYGIPPFEYVLTPRYKGSTCLSDQMSDGGLIISTCLVYVRDGKLLNCRLLSSERIVPDIYHLTQGVTGKPISVYIHLKKMQFTSTPSDAKSILMAEYGWKDSVLAKWEKRLKERKNGSRWISQFVEVKGSQTWTILNQIAHLIAILLTANSLGRTSQSVLLFLVMYCAIGLCHTIGWFINATSMESVPFETFIKAVLIFL